MICVACECRSLWRTRELVVDLRRTAACDARHSCGVAQVMWDGGEGGCILCLCLSLMQTASQLRHSRFFAAAGA